MGGISTRLFPVLAAGIWCGLTLEPALAEAPQTDCDLAAATDVDDRSQAPSVPWKDLDGYRALGACTQAVQQYPASGRIMALLSRAYNKLEDYENSLKWARRSAETGYPYGYFWLGIHYSYGDGVSKDLELYCLNMKKASDLDLPAGAHNTGVCYREGSGFRKDVDQAIAYFEKGGRQLEYAKSYVALGEIWEKGETGRTDLAKALDYYRLAETVGGRTSEHQDRVTAALGASGQASPSVAAPAQDLSFVKEDDTPHRPNAGSIWVQVASRQARDEAILVAMDYKTRFPYTRLFRSENGWYAIVIGTAKTEQAQGLIADMASEGKIPDDSYATMGENFVAELAPLVRPDDAVVPANPPAPQPVPTAPGEPKLVTKAPTVAEDQPPAVAQGPVAVGGGGSIAEPFSPDMRWIVAGYFSDAGMAHTRARRMGNLGVMQLSDNRYAVLVGNGSSARMQAEFDRLTRNGELPDDARIDDGSKFVKRVFQTN